MGSELTPQPTPIPLFTLESGIKRKLRGHLRSLGLQKNSKGELSLSGSSKEPFRDAHRPQREEILRLKAAFVTNEWPKLRHFLADGSDIRATSIEPRLEIVK